MKPVRVLLGLSLLWAQTIVTSEPSLQVCGSAGTFQITVSNTTPNPLTGVQLAVQMPPGVLYLPGSVTAPANLVSATPPNQPVFALPDIPPAQSITFTYQGYAGCDVLPFLADQNNQIKNTYTLTWNGGGSYIYTPSYQYSITSGSLQYTTITNQTHTVPTAPATFSRTFTVTNAGNAPVPGFQHIETSGANLIITGASGGTIVSHTAHALTLQFGALSPGQSVTFTVNYSVEACTQLGSTFSLEWGCHNQTCQTVNATGGVSVSASGQTPNITTGSFPPNGNAIVMIDEKSCYGDQPGNGTRMLFRAANIGTGMAYNVQVTLFISEYPSSAYDPNMIARIDTNSITVRIGANGSPLPRQIIQAEAGGSTSCFSVSNVVRKLTLQVPSLGPNDTLYIEFDHYLCDISACHGYTRPNIRSVGWEVSYRGACNEFYTTSGGSNYRVQFNAPLTNTHPGTVNNGQNFNLCVTVGEEPGNYTEWFSNPSYLNTGGSPSSPNYQFQWIFTLPPGVSYAGGPVQWIGTHWNNPSIQLSWDASSVSVVGNTVTAIFSHSNRPGDWQTAWPTGSFKNSQVCIPLVLTCGTAGSFTITSQLLFNPNPTCNPSGFCYGMPQTTTISLNCPVPCPQGMLMTNFTFRRTSYGLPDNDNDGIPDGGGSLDMTKIRTDRMMVTDTATAYFEAQVQGGPWQNAWSILELGSEGDRFVPVDAYVRIRKAGGGPFYQGLIPLLNSNICGGWPNCNRFAVDLRTNSLIGLGLVPPGFQWESGDSVKIWIRVRVPQANNPGGFIGPVNATPYLYTTNLTTPLPTDLAPHPAGQRFACGSWGATMELVGYYFYATDPVLHEPQGCDTLTLYLYQYLSIGPCCSNYCSGNLFPFEYRLWSLPTQIDVTLPAGWRYVPGSAYLDHQRTQGNPTGTSASCVNQTSPPGSVPPTNPNASPLVFPLSHLFTTNGGSLIGSDDGMFGILFFKVVPSCVIASDTALPVSYTIHFSGRLNGTATSASPPAGVRIRYRGPRLSIQAVTNPVTATQNTVEWYIKVSNTSNVAASPNTFLFFQTQYSNLNVTQVIDAATNLPVPLTNGYYPIGTVNAGSDRYFYVRAQILSCAPIDTLWARVGWDCAGYPTSISSYACYNSAPRDTLTFIPTTPIVQISSTITPNPAELCDTHTVVVTLTNAGTGYAYSPYLYFILPTGVNLVPGSFEASYPAGGSWTPIAAPQSFLVLHYWDLDNQIPALSSGLPHLSPDNEIRIRFKMVTTCNYISGAQIAFFSAYMSVCNQFSYQISASPIVALSNIIVPYQTDISAPNLTLTGCQSVHTYTISITNLGTGSTTSNDSVRVIIPAGIFITGSTIAIQNFTAHAPTITSSGGNTILTWGLQAGHGPGAVMSFGFQFQISPSLPAGTYPLTIQTVINANRACGNTTCNVFYPTGTKNATLTLVRPAGLWTGEISSDWFNSNNWGDCEIPTCTKDVIIPDTINDPIISDGIASCRDITIEPGAVLTITGTGQLDICRNYWLKAGATLAAQTNSHIRFVGPANNQTYRRDGTGDPYHVTIAQGTPGFSLILLSPLEFDGTLTLTQGVIDGYTHGKETYARTPSASVVTIGNPNSYISGVLRRRLNNSASDGWYYLPVGHLPSGKGYQLGQVLFSSAPTATHLTAQFLPWPGTPPTCVTQTDCGANFGTLPNLNNGYWIIERIGGTVPPYHLRLFARNYTNASGSAYAIVKRPTGSSGLFTFDGVCEGTPYDQASQTGRLQVSDFSEFAIAQSPIPLAVQFIHVSAIPRSSSVEVTFSIRPNWELLYQHHIERSADGISWSVIGSLSREDYIRKEGEVGHYVWKDTDVEQGGHYFYRIRAMERTGSSYLSPVVEATLPQSEQLLAAIVPNPSHNEAYLELSKSGYPVRIWDAAGKLVWEGVAAQERTPLPAELLSAGVYVVEVGGVRLRWMKR